MTAHALPEYWLMCLQSAEQLVRKHADESSPWAINAPGGAKRLAIERFRPNVIVSGVNDPFGEDDWIEATVEGQGSFLFPNRCPRCMVSVSGR